MAELTEKEIQEMIRKAREGDADANYRMSEWALEQAVAEPEEERWNTLAARCLVKAAEAGHEQAKARMEELIRQLEAEKEAAPAQPQETDYAEEAPEEDEEPAVRPAQTVRRPRQPESEPQQKNGASFDIKPYLEKAGAAAGKAVEKIKDIFKKPEGSAAGEKKPAPKTAAKTGAKGAAGLLNFSSWDDAAWKKAQRICLIVCAVLAVVIIIILLSGRGKKEAPEAVEPTPEITVEATTVPVPTATPEPVQYPDDTVRAAIAEASLDVAPAEADYVTEPTTMTVKTNGGVLHVRRGNSTNYSTLTSIPNGTSVEVFAMKSDWALVIYDGTYGWCSAKYLT